MKRLIIAICFLFPQSSFAQLDLEVDTAQINRAMYNVLVAIKETQYVSLMNANATSATEKRWHPFVLEARISPYFLLYKGRPHQSIRIGNHTLIGTDFLQNFSLVFNPDINFRMLDNEQESFPVRPPNFIPKFTFNFFLNKLKRNRTRFDLVSVIFAHYSNGQSGSFYDKDGSTINLINGNFSTNFLRLEYTYSKIFDYSLSQNGFYRNSFFSGTFAFQRDGDAGGPFGYEPGLDEQGYGRWRISGTLIFRSGNSKFFNCRSILRVIQYPDDVKRMEGFKVFKKVQENGQPHYQITELYSLKSIEKIYYRPRTMFTWMFKVQTNYVLDKLWEKNIVNPFQLNAELKLTSTNWRNLGFTLVYSHGRDYLNLNFRKKIDYFHLGLTFDLNYYKVPNTKYLPNIEIGDIFDEANDVVETESPTSEMTLKSVITETGKKLDNEINPTEINRKFIQYILDNNQLFKLNSDEFVHPPAKKFKPGKIYYFDIDTNRWVRMNSL